MNIVGDAFCKISDQIKALSLLLEGLDPSDPEVAAVKENLAKAREYYKKASDSYFAARKEAKGPQVEPKEEPKTCSGCPPIPCCKGDDAL